MNLRSSLAGRTPSGPKTDDEVRAECRRAWHANGIALLKADWFTAWSDKKQLELLAEKVFGKRREG